MGSVREEEEAVEASRPDSIEALDHPDSDAARGSLRVKLVPLALSPLSPPFLQHLHLVAPRDEAAAFLVLVRKGTRSPLALSLTSADASQSCHAQ